MSATPAATIPPSAEPPRRRRVRDAFNRLEWRLAGSSVPHAEALHRAARIATVRWMLSRRWPAAKHVAALFGTGPLESRRIALAIAANEGRDRLIVWRTFGAPLDAFVPLVGWRDPDAAKQLAPPAILLAGHFGALHLLSAGLQQLPFRRLVLRWGPQHEHGPEESSAYLGGGLAQRTRALYDAHRTLREGGLVSTTLDGGNGAAAAVRVLGQHLDLGLGAFALAERTGARLVPAAALWRGRRIECEVGPPVTTPQEAASWLEQLLRREPGQIGLGLLRRLLFGPPVEPPTQHASPL